MKRELAEQLEEQAKKRGVSVSSYLQRLVIADVGDAKDKAILAVLEEIERRIRKIHEDIPEFMRKVRGGKR